MNYGTSKEGLLEKAPKISTFRLLLGANGILLLAVLGLIIALVVVTVNKSNTEMDGQTNKWQASVPDCPLNPGSMTPELERAKCILDSYPLIDG